MKAKTTPEQEHEKALDQYISHQMRIRETLESIAAKITDNVAPEDVNWGHVAWIADLSKYLEEIDREF